MVSALVRACAGIEILLDAIKPARPAHTNLLKAGISIDCLIKKNKISGLKQLTGNKNYDE
jgi:hypothetical protein